MGSPDKHDRQRTPGNGRSRRRIAPDGGWPGRRHYLAAAMFFTGIAVYGSLVPLDYRPLAFDEAVARFRQIPYLALGVGSRTDWVANILLTVPIGYCWMGAFLAGRRFGRAGLVIAPAVVVGSAAMSIAIEFAQLWFPDRISSQNDVVAQCIGACIGVGLWMAAGPGAHRWLQSYTAAKRPEQQIDWLLRAYLLGLLIYSVLPLDLTINPAEVMQKYRDGKIVLVPFACVNTDLTSVYGLLRDVVVFVPVGMLAATWLTSSSKPVRPLGTSVLLGGLVVLATETTQLLVYTRHTSTGDVITGTLGVAIGAWIMRRLRATAAENGLPTDEPSLLGRRARLCGGLAAVYVLLLAVVFCADSLQTLDPDVHQQEIRTRFEGFFCVPFASLHKGSNFNAISEVLKKTLFYAPLGVLAALVIGPMRIRRTTRWLLMLVAVAAAAGVSTAIEMAQVFLPPRVPDVTDVILCTAGATVGLLVTMRLVDARRE
ncbi:MAG: VanZ family protein [Candidatus Nealsonbacteria bacterium]|nr:VanZ family protein [Candidatus Nealsonbacteria bacterium]